MSNQSRRSFMVQSGQVVLGTVLGSQLLVARAEQHGHEHGESEGDFTTAAGVDKICVNCEYWGGVRKVSEDGKQITGQGQGWCNNSASRNYQKMTSPDAGPMMAWKKWGALA